MPKFKVFVTGTLDYDYEVEAEDKWSAEKIGEQMFQSEFGLMWSGVQTEMAEEIEDES